MRATLIRAFRKSSLLAIGPVSYIPAVLQQVATYDPRASRAGDSCLSVPGVPNIATEFCPGGLRDAYLVRNCVELEPNIEDRSDSIDSPAGPNCGSDPAVTQWEDPFALRTRR